MYTYLIRKELKESKFKFAKMRHVLDDDPFQYIESYMLVLIPYFFLSTQFKKKNIITRQPLKGGDSF